MPKVPADAHLCSTGAGRRKFLAPVDLPIEPRLTRRQLAEFVAALRPHGAARRRRNAAHSAAHRRRLLRHRARGSEGAGRCASSARCPSSRSRPTGRRRSSAIAGKWSGCARPARSCPMRCRASSARTARTACSRWSTSTSAQHPVWKAQLARRRHRSGVRCRGRQLRGSHPRRTPQATRRSRKRFATDHIFFPDPAGALSHRHCARAPRRAPHRSNELVRVTGATKLALVHGDVSPKNILCGPRGPVFLDAECAWYGDPAFDLAFCLNHMLLKCLWRPQWSARYLACFDALAAAYLAGVTWEPRAAHRSARRRAAAGAVPRARRRQVAGRVHHRRLAARSGARAWPSRCCCSRSTTLAEVRMRWQAGRSSRPRSLQPPS